MKKISKIFAVAALFIASATFSANAQLYYGVKAGANLSAISAIKGAGKTTSGYGYQAGFAAGLNIPIIGIGIDAEALWVNNKFSTEEFGDINSDSIEIPVMASIPVLPIIPIRIKVGPSFMLYNKATAHGGEKELDPIKSSIGYTVGLALNISKITLDVRYNGQFKSSSPFSSLGSELANTPSSYDFRTNTFSASLGYRF